MSLSLSHGRTLDVGRIGIAGDDLPPFEAGPIDLASWFAAAEGPLELEIGCGKGTFIVRQAEQSLEVNFIGIEYARAYWRYAADRCRRHQCDNVRLVHTEAGSFVRNYVRDATFQQVHIYFPDPWPKKRHHKRRLIQTPFLIELHRTLTEAGHIHITTDHADYFSWIEAHTTRAADHFERLPFTPAQAADAGELVGTNFERKYRTQGRTFYGMTLVRR